MAESRAALETVYVLHRRPYRDSSLILELLGRHQGRLAVLARGVRRPRARRLQILEPFRPLLAAWRGRGELPVLTCAEPVSGRRWLAPALLPHGFYLNELLLCLLHRNDPVPEIFQAYDQALAALAQAPRPAGPELERHLRIFEKRLLEALGYGLDLHYDRQGKPIEPDRPYRYRFREGAVAVAAVQGGAALPSAEREGGEVIVQGRTLLNLAAGCLEDARSLQESKRLLRLVLAGLLGDRPLHSRKLWRPDVPTGVAPVQDLIEDPS